MTILGSPRIVGEAVLLDYPVRLGTEQSDRFADLVRELELIVLAAEEGIGGGRTPPRLLELSELVISHFHGLFHVVWQQRVAALSEGLDRIDVRFPLTPETHDLVVEWATVLEEIDQFCGSGELLMLVTPPPLRRLRQWEASEMLRQLQGEPPIPWPGPW